MTIYDVEVKSEAISDWSLLELESKVNDWFIQNMDKWVRDIKYTTSVKSKGNILFSAVIVYDEDPIG